MDHAAQSRFWSKVKKANSDQCWLWTAHVIGHMKYGRLRINANKRILAHRASWEIHFGEIPKGFHVLHKCDNPICVNPHHLFLGTDKDNWHDAKQKGRRPTFKGINNSFAKLTETQVRKIRKDARTQCEIAKDYNVTQTAISSIRLRKTWRHI